MRSFSRALGIALALAAFAPASRAQAQLKQAAQQPSLMQPLGFAVERLYPSAPGGGWWVMDTLDMHGGPGGAIALSLGYAGRPLRVTDGVKHLAVVSDQAFADIGFAVTWRRWRFYLNLDAPIAIRGQSGSVGDYSFAAPSVDFASHPDRLVDARFGVDVRIVGGPASRFRLGAGVQLLPPNLSAERGRADYDTDGTFRGMLRVLVAGDVARFSYASHVGVHIRPLDDAPAPGSPHGSELLFGAAAGAKFRAFGMALVVGPELFGATAFRDFFGANYTAVEALLAGRLEGTRDDRLQLRVKLGVGGGLHQRFGAPEWRIVVGVEMFNRNQKPPRPEVVR
jgi:hypothetical protein